MTAGAALRALVVVGLMWPNGATAAGATAGCSTVPVIQRSGVVSYPLPRTFLAARGDSVWTRTRTWIPGVDFLLERTRGVLRLRESPVPGETLWVRVCGLIDPPALEYGFETYRPRPEAADSARAGPEAGTRPATRRRPEEAPADAALTLTGNKSVAVEFGSSQDAFLRQSLDLAVTGTLAPGVELTGALSDRNTPLAAGGSTRDLQSLDRLLIELRAPQARAALGDIPLQIDRGEFGRVDRRLQGARGEFGREGLEVIGAAASATGEFRSVQFFGIDGQQGPYALPGPDGRTGFAVVPGSETVTLDGERLARGESADYAIDYERAEVRFSNRRPVSSASRVTVDYQVAVHRYRRNFAAASTRLARGPWSGAVTVITEGDDRGRPITATFDATDALVLAGAGDSTGLALGAGVVAGGDYDLVQGPAGPYYAYAGPDSGAFGVSFAAVGAGRGDYADSAVVAGRSVYRFTGPAAGTHRIGRALPLPDAHQLFDAVTGLRWGALRLDLEGALSRIDRNTFSSVDDGDNWGGAGHARLGVEGAAPRWLGGRAGFTAEARRVEQRFAPFARIEKPFVQEDWGLPPGTDLEHSQRAEVAGFFQPGVGGELRVTAGGLETESGFRSRRTAAAWDRPGLWTTRARWERADGEQANTVFADGGRERRGAEVGLRLKGIEPWLRAETDERWTPSDTGRVGERHREVGGELRSGGAQRWRGGLGLALRRNERLGAAGWAATDEARSARIALHSPEDRAWVTSLSWQRRDVRPATGGRTASDLASARLHAADAGRGLRTQLGLEITSEGESERSRQVVFAGAGQGAYDSLGTLVGAGRGDYTLVVTLTGGLRRVTRTAASARAGWQWPGEGAWQGTRAEVSVESEARRIGGIAGGDLWLAAGDALGDAALSRGQVTQRFETELAPATAGALYLRGERRVNADRSFSGFIQLQDERSAALRWRVRPAAAWTGEVEGRLRRTAFEQSGLGGAGVARRGREGALQAVAGFTPGPRLRLGARSDLSWVREDRQPGWSATWMVGPELGASVFAAGRLEITARRAVVRGTEASTLVPFGDPLGAVRWEVATRFDYRLRDRTTMGLSMVSRDRERRAPEHEGRAEVRAFF